MSSKESYREIKTLLKEKRFADVIAFCEKSLRNTPNDPNLFLAIASAYHGVEEYLLSISSCKKVLALDPFDAQAFNGIFSALEKLRKPLEAADSLEPLKTHFLNQKAATEHFALVQKQIDVLKKFSKFDEVCKLLQNLLRDSQITKTYLSSHMGCKRMFLLTELEGLLEKSHEAASRRLRLNLPKNSAELKREEGRLYEASQFPSIMQEIIAILSQNKNERHDDRIPKHCARLACWLVDSFEFDLCKESKERFLFMLTESLDYLHSKQCLHSPKLRKAFADLHLPDTLSSYDDFARIAEWNNVEKGSVLHFLFEVVEKFCLKDSMLYFSVLSETKQAYAKTCNTFGVKVPILEEFFIFLDAMNLFLLKSYEDAFEMIKKNFKEFGSHLRRIEIEDAILKILNKQNLFHEAIDFCDMLDPKLEKNHIIIQKSWQYFCLKDYSNALKLLDFASLNEDYFENYLRGRIAYALGKKDDAFDFFVQSAKLNSKFSPSFAHLGFYYFEKKDFDRSKKCFLKSIELDLEDAEPSIENLCHILFLQQDYAQAAAVLRIHLKQYPRSSVSLKKLSICQLKTNDIEGCIATLLLYLRIGFRDAESWELLGECYLKVGRYNASLKAFLHALQFEPTLSCARFNVGLIYDKMGKFSMAISNFKSLLDDPVVGFSAFKELLDSTLDLFTETVNKRCFGLAFSQLQDSLCIIQKNVQSTAACFRYYGFWRFLGLVFYYSSMFPSLSLKETILVTYEQLFVSDPEISHNLTDVDLSVYCFKRALNCTTSPQFQAVIYAHLGSVCNDEISLQKAIILDNKNIKYWNSLGVVYFKKGLWAQSQHCFIKSLYLDAKSAISWVLLGFLHLKCSPSDRQLAVRTFEEAQKISSHLVLGWIGLYLATRSSEYLLHAIDICEVVIPEMLFLVGKFCFCEKYRETGSIADLTEALVSFQQYILLCPNSAEGWNFLGLVAEAQGHSLLAADYFSAALERASQSNGSCRIDEKPIILNKARSLIFLQKYSAAFELLDQNFEFSSLNSIEQKFVYTFALFHVDQNKAMGYFYEIYEDSADSAEFIMYFVKILLSAASVENKHELAESQLLAILKKEPNNIEAIKALLLLNLYTESPDMQIIKSCISQLKRISIAQKGIYLNVSSFLVKIYQILGMDHEIACMLQQNLLLDPLNPLVIDSLDRYFDAREFVCEAQAIAFQRVDFNAENKLSLIKQSPKSIQESLLLSKYCPASWKAYFFRFLECHNAFDCNVHAIFQFFDAELAEIVKISQNKHDPLTLLEQYFLNKDSKWSLLSLEMFFILATDKNQILSAAEYLQKHPCFLPYDTITEIAYQLYCKGFKVPDCLKELVNPLYKCLFEGSDASSIKAITAYAKTTGGHTSSTLLLQALLGFYLHKNTEMAAKNVTKVLSVQPDNLAAAVLEKIIK